MLWPLHGHRSVGAGACSSPRYAYCHHYRHRSFPHRPRTCTDPLLEPPPTTGLWHIESEIFYTERTHNCMDLSEIKSLIKDGKIEFVKIGAPDIEGVFRGKR